MTGYGLSKARQLRARRASATSATRAKKTTRNANPPTINWHPLQASQIEPFNIDWAASMAHAQQLRDRAAANTFTLLKMPTGSGKTAVAVAALGLMQAELGHKLPFIVIAPRAVVEQRGWDKTIMAWNTSHPNNTLDPLMIDKPDHFANVCNNARTLKDTMQALGAHGVVVIDEVHMYKSPTSKRSKTLQRLHAKTIIGLSATPLTNDIISDSISYLVKNRMYTSKTAFYRESGLDRFVGMHGELLVYNDDQSINRDVWPYVDTMTGQLSDVIIAPAIDMSTIDMPEVNSVLMQLDVDVDVDAKIESVLKAHRAGAFESPVDVGLAIIETLCESTKRLDELVKLITEPGVTQPLVFYWHNSTRDAIRARFVAEGIRWQEISGSAPVSNVDFTLDMPILVQYQAGSEGVEMKKSNTTVFYENQHSVARLEQAKGRNVRRGQTGTTTQYTLLSHTSFESRIVERIINKKDVNDEVLAQIVEATARE